MQTETIIYEQPVNEHIRACLRLERLFQQAMHGIHGSSTWDSRITLAAIIDILTILERADLKTKIAKELGRHLTTLNRLEKTPQVDHPKLTAILIELEDIIDILHTTSGKIAQELRDNDFLNSIRQHLPTPGGTCSFDTPAYHLWLQQPAAERLASLAHWLKALHTIQSALNLLLMLTRQNCGPQDKIAHLGFFQTALDPQAPCQLIRVGVASELKIYPEISVGRHGICVRFFPLFLNQRPTPITEDVSFKLTTCIF